MENNSKVKIYKKYTKYLSIFFIIFFLGLSTERFGLDNKVSLAFKNSLDSFSRFLYSFTSKEKIFINIKPRNYDRILKTRELSLKKNKLTEDLHDWVPAKLVNEGNSHNIKIRLKGAFADHWEDSVQWSFKIKVDNDSKSIFGLRRFAIQPPKTISYLYEWLFMKALEKEKLISLGARYLDVIINGNSRGAYLLQGQASKELIKSNNREDGPVIGFSKNLFLEEQINSDRLNAMNATGSLNGIEDSFWRAKIEPVQFSDKENKTKQESNLKKAIYLLESFRNGSLKPSQVFDVDQLTKVMALRAILGSSEFDWRDTKFYFNPKTSLLEPISREIHVDLNLNFKDHYFSWWIDSSHMRPHYVNNTNFFIDILYKDKKFYRKYLSELNRLSKTKYYEDLIQENSKDFKKYKKILKNNYPTKKIFSKEHLEINRIRIQDFLDPIQGLNVYFLDYKDDLLFLDVSNLQRIPAEILGIEFEGKSKIYLKKPFLIEGKKPLLPLKNNTIKIHCQDKKKCGKLLIDKHKIIFKILGQEKEKKTEISKHYYKSE